MARYVSNQNKVLGIFESGTYGTKFAGGSGQFWIGQVTENTITDAENPIEIRHLGTGRRGPSTFVLGPHDVTGTLTYHPQNMQMLAFAIGSIFGVSGTHGVNHKHTATEIHGDSWQNPFCSGTGQPNAPISFTIEDSKQAPGTGRNFIRTINGVCVNTTTLSLTQGERAVMTVDYIGQGLTHSSGATTTLVEETRRPYLWADASVDMTDDAGNKSGLTTLREVSLEVNQNLTGQHYLKGGSRVITAPTLGNKDMILTLTGDLDGDIADMLYHKFYQGGSPFHVELDLNNDVEATGSQHAEIFLSGCHIISMDIPSALEGTTENTIEIRAGSINLIEEETTAPSGLYHDGINW